MIKNEISLQPNLRYRLDFIVAELKEVTYLQSNSDVEAEFSENPQTFGLDIVLPFICTIKDNWDVGADICICG